MSAMRAENERRLLKVELQGERVRLVPVAPCHAADAFRMLHGEDGILRWLVWEGPQERGDLELAYAEWARPKERGSSYHFAILEPSSGAFAGTIAARFSAHPDTGDIGYWLGRAFWGRGLMSEAVWLVGHLCFRHLETRVMSASVFVGNLGSRRVLEKNGYRLTHLAQNQVIKRGAPVDEWCFTLTRHDFDRVHAGRVPEVECVEWA